MASSSCCLTDFAEPPTYDDSDDRQRVYEFLASCILLVSSSNCHPRLRLTLAHPPPTPLRGVGAVMEELLVLIFLMEFGLQCWL
ncbi:hypothetical protein C1H46_029045 [Malus baccata]|uniref:Uncharacterized protein n=1 Tax=Malus baccata TaxID=106549 RepID=A0A540LG08_MALBA|nr:hypothetical protein C1H46_029045 [Malus baccata]